MTSGRLPNGRLFVDLLAPLYLILGIGADVTEHEANLFDQVMPVVDALLVDS